MTEEYSYGRSTNRRVTELLKKDTHPPPNDTALIKKVFNNSTQVTVDSSRPYGELFLLSPPTEPKDLYLVVENETIHGIFAYVGWLEIRNDVIVTSTRYPAFLQEETNHFIIYNYGWIIVKDIDNTSVGYNLTDQEIINLQQLENVLPDNYSEYLITNNLIELNTKNLTPTLHPKEFDSETNSTSLEFDIPYTGIVIS